MALPHPVNPHHKKRVIFFNIKGRSPFGEEVDVVYLELVKEAENLEAE